MSDSHTTRPLQAGSQRTHATQIRTGSGSQPRAGAGELVLDRYRLEQELGRGGHGAVWEAVDERLERQVAVKAIPREGSIGPRAEREGRVAARLNHPGIVGLYELGSDDSTVYLVSELVRGRTMAELARAGGLSDRDVCEIGIALCAALEHAHARGVVHRDVKPQNVIVVSEPAAGAGFAKLTDFGIARVVDESTLTRTGDVVGTLAYMAPEQAQGQAVSAAADVYSLALVLYEGWTGSGPESAVAGRLAGHPLPPLRRLRRDLPQELSRVVDAALDPRPAARPALAELGRALSATAEALSERGGLVEPATRSRFGIPSARAYAGGGSPTIPAWIPRVAAGAAAGGLVAAALAVLGPAPEFAPPALGGAATAAAVALLPRIGWMLAAAAVLAWLVSPAVDLRGTALVIAPAVAAVPVLLPRAGLVWSLPALAPLLGAVALAPLYVAVAALAPTAWRRAALALAGFAWLAAAELVSGSTLLFGVADGAEPAGAWERSLIGAARDAIYPTLTSPALLPAAAWVLLAPVLGLVARLRRPAFALVGVVAWAVAAISAHEWLAELLDGAVADPRPRGAVAGLVLGAILVLVVAVVVPRERSDQPLVP